MDLVEDFVLASRRSGVAEVCWRDVRGAPRATAVVPLEHDGRPALALHWSQWDAARELVASPSVAWLLSDRRMAQRGWEPASAVGRMRLVVDQDGSLFVSSLLDQELRKHPPSRAFADSPLLRKEHWWFLPRLVLVFEATEARAVAERTDPSLHAVLAVQTPDGGLFADTVAVQQGAGVTACTSLAPAQLPAAGPAVLLRHDFSAPDLERWGRQETAGSWDGTQLSDIRTTGTADVPPPLGLLQRVRRHRELERECRRALRERPPA